MPINRSLIINKTKPFGSSGAVYKIVPTQMTDSSSNYVAALPTLTEDSTIALSTDIPKVKRFL